jgi:transcriptional regulator with XRE-family HTH domain
MGEDGFVGDDEQPMTPAGQYLTRRMSELGFKTKADLADTAGVARSTITRLFKRPEYRPDVDVMRRLARGLQVEHDDLVAAIYGEPADAEPALLHPLAAELGRMLADDSPLSRSTRAVQEFVVDRVMETGRGEMRGGAQFLGYGQFGAVFEAPAPESQAETVAIRVPLSNNVAAAPTEFDDDPDPLEAKLERLPLLALSLNPTDRRRLADSVQMLLEWVDARRGVPEMTDEERERLEAVQRSTRAASMALREWEDRGGGRQKPGVREEPADL